MDGLGPGKKPLFDDEAGNWESLYRDDARGARWGILQGYARKRVRARLDLCLGLLPPVGGMRVIELGCGPGYYGTRLIDAGAEWAGVDLSDTMLRRCRRTTGSTRLVRADVRQLPFRPRCADAVLCIGVLSYLRLAEIASLFSQVFDLLRPRGLFLAQTVRFDPLTWVRCRLPSAVPRPLRIPGPFYPRSPAAMRRLLEEKGLVPQRIVPYRKFGFYPAGTVYLAHKSASRAR